MRIIRHILKWTGITLCTILLLPVLLVSILYIPAVQNWAAQKAVAIASEATGMSITVDRVGITPLLDIELENLTAIQETDTILHTGTVIVDLDFKEITEGKVGIESIDIQDGVFNTKDIIPQLQIKGSLGALHLDREDTDLKNGLATLSEASVSACNLDISMRDTVIIDTTESAPLPWSILVKRIDIKDSRIAFRSAGDTLSVGTTIRHAYLTQGDIRLAEGIYQIEHLGVNLDTLSACIKDSCGAIKNIPLPATSLEAEELKMDTAGMAIGFFRVNTGSNSGAQSSISGNLHMDFNALVPKNKGMMSANLKASLSHSDILGIAKDFIPKDLARSYPTQPLNAHISVNGNIDSINIDTLHLLIPKSIDACANGYIANAMSIDPMRSDLCVDVSTMNLNFVSRYLGLSSVNIPSMNLSAQTQIEGATYKADALIRRGEGTVRAKAYLDMDNMAYQAKLLANEINIADFLPNDSIGLLTFSASVKGIGTDPLSKATGIKAELDLKHLEYKNWNVDNARFTAKLKQGRASAELHCDNEILMANACVNADIDKKLSRADFAMSLNKINFQALGITQDSLVASMVLNIDGNTDMQQTHRLMGSVHSIELAMPDTTFYPLDLNLEVNTNEESILARTNAGNLWLQFHSDEGLDSLLQKTDALVQELKVQKEDRQLNYKNLKAKFPRVDFHILCGDNNPVANIMRSMLGTTFNELAVDLIAAPEKGVRGKAHLHKLKTAAVVLDSISLNIAQLDNGIGVMARVKNGPKNKVVNFESKLNALITPEGLKSHLLFLDDKGRKGIDLGVNVETADSSMSVHLTPLTPILAYRTFNVNEDNFISIDKQNHILADMNLQADDGTSLNLYSMPNEYAEQDVTLSIANFNLGELSNVLPFMPIVTGMLNGDIHAVKEAEQATLSVDLDIDKMGYEGSPLGNIGVEMIYFPNADGSHLVDGILSQNKRNIALLNGSYWTEQEEGQIEAEAQLLRLPLNIANGFITDNMARLEGYITGIMDVSGAVSALRLSGAMSTDSVHICSDPYSIDLRLPDDTVVIRNNFIDLDEIQSYANGNNPLTLDGTIDFTDLEQARLDLNVVARDFNLINAPKRKGAEAYGKVYVDLYGRMQGTLNDLDIRGRLNINGKTNVTYVMKDSPLVVDDQLSSLVTFTDFSDTTETKPITLPEQNVKMDFQVKIDEATTIHCLMSEDGQDNIEIEGGGELRMTYDMLSGMRLFGRYTVLSGSMDYSLVVMSLKNFNIDNGSYVEFMGDMMDPKLNISASERKKASVTSNNSTRSVNFDVGLKITQTLSDLGLEFTLEAPEDISVQNELSSMSVEERGRAAVAMLTTGLYLSPNNGASGEGFNASSALTSFLNSQISNIAGKALSTIDIGFGIDNTTSATGATQTDYNFSFAKRFWGNRISVIIGGKVSSGNDAQNTGMSIINNVSVEYRLDNSGTRYVKAFYNKDTESILDSEVMEMGASLVLRRKTENLSELFIFRDTKKKKAAETGKVTKK